MILPFQWRPRCTVRTVSPSCVGDLGALYGPSAQRVLAGSVHCTDRQPIVCLAGSVHCTDRQSIVCWRDRCTVRTVSPSCVSGIGTLYGPSAHRVLAGSVHCTDHQPIVFWRDRCTVRIVSPSCVGGIGALYGPSAHRVLAGSVHHTAANAFKEIFSVLGSGWDLKSSIIDSVKNVYHL